MGCGLPRGVVSLSATLEARCSGELISILWFPLVASLAGEERKKRGEEDATFRRGAGLDIVCNFWICQNDEQTEKVSETRKNTTRKSLYASDYVAKGCG